MADLPDFSAPIRYRNMRRMHFIALFQTTYVKNKMKILSLSIQRIHTLTSSLTLTFLVLFSRERTSDVS